MTLTFDRRAPAVALRKAVFGFLTGTAFGGLFFAVVFLLDIGHVATLAAREGFPFGDLGILPLTFGLIGMVVGPALGSMPDETAA